MAFKKVLDFISGKPLQESLDDLERQLAAARADLGPLQEKYRDEVTAAELGYSGARETAGALSKTIAKVNERIATLTTAIDGVRRKIEAERIEAERAATAKIPGRVDKARKNYLAAIVRAEKSSDEYVAALRDQYQAAEELKATIGTDEARRLFGLGAFKARLVTHINKFAVHPQKSGVRGMGDHWSFFDFSFGDRNPWLKRNLIDVTLEALDNIVPVYLDETDAQAAAARLAERGEKFVVLPVPAGGFVLRPPRHSGEAA